MRHRVLLTLIPVMGLTACYKSILDLLRRPRFIVCQLRLKLRAIAALSAA